MKRIVTLAEIQNLAKGSTSPSNFDGELSNISVKCFSLCVVAAAWFQNAQIVFYFLVWWHSKF